MPVPETKNAIHPIAIVKQAGGVYGKNLGRLGAIYLIFNLPITVISLFPAVRPLQNQKPSLTTVIWFLFLIAISSWGHIALLLGTNKAVGGQDYTIGQSIGQAKAFLVKYLALILSVTLLVLGILIVAGVSAVVVLAFLARARKMLAALICFVVLIVVIVSLVFFLLRWSLAALVCVFENAGPIAALKRSFTLVQEHVNPVVGIYGLMALAYIVCLLPVMITAALSATTWQVNQSAQLGTTIYAVLLNIILVPFWTTITVVLYRKLQEALEAHVYA